MLKTLLTLILAGLSNLLFAQSNTVFITELYHTGNYSSGQMLLVNNGKLDDIPFYHLTTAPYKHLKEHNGKLIGISGDPNYCILQSENYYFAKNLFISDGPGHPMKSFDNRYIQNARPRDISKNPIDLRCENFCIDNNLVFSFFSTSEPDFNRGIDIINVENQKIEFKINFPPNTYPNNGTPTVIENKLYYSVGRAYSDTAYILTFDIFSHIIDTVFQSTTPELSFSHGKYLKKDNFLYGIFSDGNFQSQTEYLTRIDLISGQTKTLFTYDPSSFYNPNGEFIEVNGKYLDMAGLGGTNDRGMIYQFDINSETVETVNILSNPGPSNPFGNLVYLDNKIYGLFGKKNDQIYISVFELDLFTRDIKIIQEYSCDPFYYFQPITGLVAFQQKLFAYGPQDDHHIKGKFIELNLTESNDIVIDPGKREHYLFDNPEETQFYKGSFYNFSDCNSGYGNLISANIYSKEIKGEFDFADTANEYRYNNIFTFKIIGDNIYGLRSLDDSVNLFSYNLITKEYNQIARLDSLPGMQGMLNYNGHIESKPIFDSVLYYYSETFVFSYNLQDHSFKKIPIGDECYKISIASGLHYFEGDFYVNLRFSNNSSCNQNYPRNEIGIISPESVSIEKCLSFNPSSDIQISNLRATKNGMYAVYIPPYPQQAGIYRIEPKTGAITETTVGTDSMYFNAIYAVADEENIYFFSQSKSNPSQRYLAIFNTNTNLYSYHPLPGKASGFYTPLGVIPSEELAVKESPSNNKNVKLFPNPTQGNFRLEIINREKIKQVELFNLSGIKVKSFSGYQSEFNISDLSSGVYLVKIQAESGSIQTEKLLLID